MIRRYVGGEGIGVTVSGTRVTDSGEDRIFEITGAHPYPGFVNAHDHLQLNHFPRLGRPPYRSMYQWADDIHEAFQEEIAAAKNLPIEDALLFGALKNLAGGATAVVHHDIWHPLLDGDFPIKLVRVRVAHSPGLETHLDEVLRGEPDLPLCIHVSEGTDPALADEVRRLGKLGLLTEHFMGVHCVSVDTEGIEALTGAGAGVVWCPSSNQFLYGATIGRELARADVDLMLGTDSLLTGDGTILEELVSAREAGVLDDPALLACVTATPARRLGLPENDLQPGDPADIVFLARAPGIATIADVRLVLVDGSPRMAQPDHADVFEAQGVDYRVIESEPVEFAVTIELADCFERVVRAHPERRRLTNAGTARTG